MLSMGSEAGDKASEARGCLGPFRVPHATRSACSTAPRTGTPLPAASPGGRREPRPRPASSPGADLGAHVTHPAAAGARGRSSAEAWPGRAERSRPERAARQGGSGRRASRRIRPRALKPSLGAGTPGGRAAGGHGRRRRAGRRLVHTRGAAGRRGGPQARVESGTRSPSVPGAGPHSRWRRRPSRRKGCCSGFYHCIPSSGPPRESAGAAGSPLR